MVTRFAALWLAISICFASPAFAYDEKKACKFIGDYAQDIGTNIKQLSKVLRDSGLDEIRSIEDSAVRRSVSASEFARGRLVSSMRDYATSLEDLEAATQRCAER